MKYLIVGLGNPGAKYQNTRHNIGFSVLDAWVDASNTDFEVSRHGDVAKDSYKGRKLIFLKPTTYMNLSGKAVNYWLQEEKIPLERLLIITDDVALPFGKLRLKGKGSDGGHNGLKDIEKFLNTSKYARLRFGVGNEYHKGSQIDYVLGEWSPKELDERDERISTAHKFIQGFVSIGLQRTMSEFNNK